MLGLKFKDAFGDAFCLHLVIDGPVRAGNRGHAKAARQALGVDLVAQFTDDLPRRADKDEFAIALGHTAGKTEVFGKKTVAGMHGGAACLVSHRHKLVGVVVGRNAKKAFFSTFFARKAYMARSRILGGEYGGKSHTQLAAGPHDAHGYFAAIGYQNFVLVQGNGFLSVVQACLPHYVAPWGRKR